MERRELLKAGCGVAACACLAPPAPAVSAGDGPGKLTPEDWRISFTLARIENLLDIIAGLDEPARTEILGKFGRECGKAVVKGFEGDPERFWAHAKTLWLDRVECDMEKGIIDLLEKPRTQYNCPLASLVKLPVAMCCCAAGTQEAIYERLFDRPVKATVDESVLRGAARCSFTITLQHRAGKPNST